MNFVIVKPAHKTLFAHTIVTRQPSTSFSLLYPTPQQSSFISRLFQYLRTPVDVSNDISKLAESDITLIMDIHKPSLQQLLKRKKVIFLICEHQRPFLKYLQDENIAIKQLPNSAKYTLVQTKIEKAVGKLSYQINRLAYQAFSSQLQFYSSNFYFADQLDVKEYGKCYGFTNTPAVKLSNYVFKKNPQKKKEKEKLKQIVEAPPIKKKEKIAQKKKASVELIKKKIKSKNLQKNKQQATEEGKPEKPKKKKVSKNIKKKAVK